MLFKELGLFLHAPPTLWCDNLGALALASNPEYHARTKHIEVDYHFIREKVVNKDVITRYLPTLDQLANILTKGLTTNRFLFLHDKLRVCSPPISLQGDVKHHVTALQEDTAMQIKSSKACTNPTHQDKDPVAVKDLINCISPAVNDADEGKDIEESKDMQIYSC
jgi:hypothetical protein